MTYNICLPIWLYKVLAKPLSVLFVSLAVMAQQLPSKTAESQPPPAMDEVFYLDLDTPAGSFSQWRKDDLKMNNTVVAEVQCPLMRKQSNFEPAFGLHLQDAPDHPKNVVTVQIAAYNRKTPMTMRIVGRIEGKPIQPIELHTEVTLNQRVMLTLSWDPSNILQICTGSEMHLLRLGWQPKSFSVTGSTGEFKVYPLVLRVVNDRSISDKSACPVVSTLP